MDKEIALVGLLLVLIVAAAVPMFASGVAWLAVLLLIMVWTYVQQKKAGP